MKIAVDASQLHSRYTGVGRYLYCLLKEMAPMLPDAEFTLFFKSKTEAAFNFPNVKMDFLLSESGNFLWQNMILNQAVRRGGFDLLWSPNYYSPLLFRGRSVISMHDVSWKALPDNYSLLNRMIRNFQSRLSLKRASLVFTLSEFSKNEIVRYFGTDPARIKAVHLGIDGSFRRAAPPEIARFKHKYGINAGPLLGYLGSFFKRRNVDKLIRAYQSLKPGQPGLQLMVVGENYDPGLEIILKNDPSIIRIRRLAEDEINAFYSSLDLFVYISEYEGFGLPPLEALKCGTVPFLLNKSSLREVFAGIALFAENTGHGELTRKIGDYLKNAGIVRRKILTEFLKKETYFSWKRVAEEYIELLRNPDHRLSDSSDV